MNDNSKLCLTCSLIGAVFWMVACDSLFLVCYQTLAGEQAKNLELLNEWVYALARAQMKALPVGGVCGIVLGLLTCRLFRSRPPSDHAVTRPENRRKLLAATRAEAVVPLSVAVWGAIVGACFAVFLLPLLLDSETLPTKSATLRAFFGLLFGAGVSVPILPFSLKLLSLFKKGEQL